MTMGPCRDECGEALKWKHICLPLAGSCSEALYLKEVQNMNSHESVENLEIF